MGLTKAQRAAMFDVARERGLIPDTARTIDDETVADHAHVIEDRRTYESIDDVDALPERSFVLDKPPREGGSYRILSEYVDAGDRFIVLAPRHSILHYHMETLDDLVDDDWAVVHFEGKTRVCEHTDQCPAAPVDYEEIQQWEHEVRNILHRKTTITADDAPVGLCKYWFLKTAAAFADVVLTVPQLARRFESSGDAKLFVDEEQSLQHFRPGSVDLCDIRQIRETDGTPAVQLGGAPILHQLDVLDEIREGIEAEIQERKDAPGGFREVPYQRAILNAIAAVEDITDALGLSAAQADVRSRDEDVTLASTVDELQDRLEAVEFPEPSSDADQLKDKIDEYCAPYFWDESAAPAAFLEAVLFPYSENRFHIKTVGNERTIRLIGDAERVFFRDWLRGFDQLAIVAGPEGERFIDEVADEACVIEITAFRYADEFVVLPVGKLDGDGDSMEPVDAQRSRCSRIVRLLNRDQHPCLAVTGTKDQARGLHRSLSDVADVVTDPPSPAKTLYKLWTMGATGVIYENSVVSRGIDAPFFDVTVIASPGFSTPYWEARAERWRGEDRDAHHEALSVERELKDRELTNAALRMSTTHDVEPLTGTKFIIAADSDVPRMKYLGDRIAPRVAYGKTAVGLIELLTVGGAFEETFDDIFEALGRSEKALIKTGFIEQFAEAKVERPEHEYDEVCDWVESRYLTGGVVERIMSAIDSCEGPPTTTDIYEALPGESNSRISAILKVLRRRGDVRAEREMTGEAGRPAWRWFVAI